LLNLVELSVLDGSEPAFEMYRRELSDVALPVNLTVSYHLHVGKGYQAFGRTDRARESLLRAVELAAENRLNQLLFRADESLRSLEKGERAARIAAASAPDAVADVATAIRSMKDLVGAGR
jgi:hypothetical protein